jgi:hypothetical protein
VTGVPRSVASVPGDEYLSVRDQLPPPVEELVSAFRSPITQIEFLYLIHEAGILRPVLVDAEVATRMVRPYAWLLDQVGAEGIKLTSAGYLPPVHVEAAVAELGLAAEWIGSYNRESQTLPVLELRESAMKLGLLRKYQGKLLVTVRGRELRSDPAALWWHLAENVPLAKAGRPRRYAGLLLLAAVAGQLSEDPFEYVARMLWEAGWADSRDGQPLDKWDARSVVQETYVPLVRLGALASDPHGFGPHRPTPEGATFALAALRTWPSPR